MNSGEKLLLHGDPSRAVSGCGARCGAINQIVVYTYDQGLILIGLTQEWFDGMPPFPPSVEVHLSVALRKKVCHAPSYQLPDQLHPRSPRSPPGSGQPISPRAWLRARRAVRFRRMGLLPAAALEKMPSSVGCRAFFVACRGKKSLSEGRRGGHFLAFPVPSAGVRGGHFRIGPGPVAASDHRKSTAAQKRIERADIPLRSAQHECIRPWSQAVSSAGRPARAALGGWPMMRLNARLNEASES